MTTRYPESEPPAGGDPAPVVTADLAAWQAGYDAGKRQGEIDAFRHVRDASAALIAKAMDKDDSPENHKFAKVLTSVMAQLLAEAVEKSDVTRADVIGNPS